MLTNDQATKILTEFGYNGSEMLMNSETGSVDTSLNWTLDTDSWLGGEDGEMTVEDQFSTLTQVKFIKGEWVEV